MTEYLGDTSIDDEPQMEDVEHYTEIERQRNAAFFILKAREERLLTQNALDGLLQDITCEYLFSGITNGIKFKCIGFVQYECKCMRARIHEAVDREGIDSITVADVCTIPQPFLGLETEYKQTKYFRENFQLLVC